MQPRSIKNPVITRFSRSISIMLARISECVLRSKTLQVFYATTVEVHDCTA